MSDLSCCRFSFTAEDYLMHHGIKGQKWGIRRYQNPDGTRTPAGIERYGTAENYSKSRQAERKQNIRSTIRSVKSLSDDDLIIRLGRLEKEKRYIDLTKEIESSGDSKAKQILEKAGFTAATSIATAGAIYGGKKIVALTANILGRDGDKVVRDMFPKKK